MMARARAGRVRGGHRVRRPPWLDGAGVVTAALGSTETTAQVHPARFTEALVGGAQAHGRRAAHGRRRGRRRARRRGPRRDRRAARPSRPTRSCSPWGRGRGGSRRRSGSRGFAGSRATASRSSARTCPRTRSSSTTARRTAAPGAGDLSAPRRGRVRLRHGRSGAAAGLAGGRRRRRRRMRRARARGRPRVHRAGRRARSSAGRPATGRSPTTACR